MVNAIHWEQKKLFKAVFDYYRGLIRLRREHPAFRLRTREEIEKHIRLIEKGNGLLAYELNGTAASDSWERIVVIYNAAKENRDISVPTGTWNVIVEKGQAGIDTIRTIQDGQVHVNAISLTVMYSNS